MSFDRENLAYRSLPHSNSYRTQKTVNFAMPQSQTQTQPLPTQTSKISIPINQNNNNTNGLSSSSASSLSTSGAQTIQPPTTNNNSTNITSNKVPTINTEEFAKLDALLEDLLAEVETPILLNKDGIISSTLTSNKRYNSCNDGLNFNNSTNNKENYRINSSRHINGNDDLERSVDWLNEQKERLRSRKELVNMYTSKHMKSDTDDPQNFRKLKSRLDYYVTNSNGQYQTNSLHKSLSAQTKNGFAYTTNGNSYHIQDKMFEDDNSPTILINGCNGKISENGNLNSNGYINNKPPVSPSNLRYTPQPATTTCSVPFRSLSTNPTLLRNITENDDIIEHDFDRYSQRSYRSNTSTVQRSKYHTVSNDFVECTKPTAPTPVPTFHTNKVNYPSKRALSAPPTEMGKVVLQRMELKSPLTVRQGSVVPFQYQQIAYHPNEQLIERVQTPVNGTLTRQYIENGNSNRVVLKSNNNYNNVIPSQQPTTSINCPPTRNVFLNRAYSETPRVAYTNGYETDSGIARTNSFRNQYNTYNQQMIESDMNGYNTTTNNNTNGYRTISNGYRTIQTPSRYNSNLQSGYETDSGLVKLRQVLDNRRTSSRNNIPIQHQSQPQPIPVQQIVPTQNSAYYYPPNRSMTPSFNNIYNQQLQSNQFVSSEPITTTHTQQYIVTTYPNDIETIEFIDNPEFVQPISPKLQQFQYTNNNSNGVVEKISGYIGQDGRPVILNEIIEPSVDDLNGLMSNQQSVIMQQQIAPSAYQPNDDDANSDPNTSSMMQMRDTSSRLANVSASANNISSIANGQQSLTRQDSRRSSANSLADSNEILRNHPKSVKSTQNFWYKPKISRDEAINLLKDKPPGTFLIRDSNNFPGAYGLALKVDKPPPNVQLKPGADPLNELVRHFLIEPTTKGVRIKGCYNEPIFGSLAALVYQHSLTPLALPIKLILPVRDLVLTIDDPQSQNNQQQKQQSQQSKQLNGSSNNNSTPKQSNQLSVQDARHLLEKGAACNVFYLSTINIENKNGIEAISTALSSNKAFQTKDTSQLLLIQFKVTAQGITLTDLNKKKFLRQHFPTNTVIYCAIEEKQIWPTKLDRILKPRIFGVITKPQAKSSSNECHLFVELDPDQPAIAIVDFINRYLIPSRTDTNNKN